MCRKMVYQFVQTNGVSICAEAFICTIRSYCHKHECKITLRIDLYTSSIEISYYYVLNITKIPLMKKKHTKEATKTYPLWVFLLQ